MIVSTTIKSYEIHECIGQGAFGAVYRAYQPTIDREVAIKVILPQYANQPDFIQRFETEAQVVARLEHLHIVPLYDYWRDPDGAYLVMRYLRGGNLKDWIAQGALARLHLARTGAQRPHHAMHGYLQPGRRALRSVDRSASVPRSDVG